LQIAANDLLFVKEKFQELIKNNWYINANKCTCQGAQIDL
jgi:hypothetical protein